MDDVDDEEELEDDKGLLLSESDVFLFKIHVLVIFPLLNVVAVAATLVNVGLRVKPVLALVLLLDDFLVNSSL